MAALIAAGIGAAAGGLGGLFGGGSAPKLQTAKKIGKFDGALGTATPTGFTFKQDANRQAAVDSSNQQLSDLLAGGFNIDQNRLQGFQDAFLAQRQPALERNLAQQQQQANIQQSVAGTGGSSADLFRNALQGQFANEQRGNLLNQAITGREGLANQALQQQLAQGQFLGGLSQQDIGNQLNAQNATLNALFGSQKNEIAYTDALNQVADANAANQKSSNKFGNFLSGALQGGIGATTAFGGTDGLKGFFGGGAGGSGNGFKKGGGVQGNGFKKGGGVQGNGFKKGGGVQGISANGGTWT